ncbi:H(+)-transporting V1 sector ATPase subunit H [Lunasporangiospora selenospora]|uniref:H(+)-transporting V1 sector ATPase subunit H n=1 Tax=Lunasporangiospora selenospora TaxID=979761 RepID=A0A9P6KGJ4_9FUNG|nr:H(+)-transporting V1 sector ATPase subunit H [Lunasporangiospora selenospora]
MVIHNSASESVPEVPLALVSNSFLDELTANLRARPIPWEARKPFIKTQLYLSSREPGYQRATLITHEELEYIKAVDKKTGDELSRAVDKVALYLNHEERTIYFLGLTETDSTFPFFPLLKCLRSEDEFVPLKASKILTSLLCASPNPNVEVAEELFRWTTLQLQSNNPAIVDLAAQVVESALRQRRLRLVYWLTPHAMDALIRILKAESPTPQMQYQVIYCIWTLTFDSTVAQELNRQYDVIPQLVEIAKSAIKEKVIRIIISTLRNLVEKAPEANLAAMAAVKLLTFMENLSARKWSDSDILEDVSYLKAELEENFQTLSVLARLLSTATDPLVLSVAANDVGQYVKRDPASKKFLQEIGVKQRIMELMSHPDQEVRYNSVNASWSLIGGRA